MGTLLNSIEVIPEKLKKLCENRESIMGKLSGYVEDKEINRIVVVASGTSYNAAYTTKRFGEEILDLPVEIIYPNTFYNYYNQEFLSSDVLYIFISQTGSTKLVHDSLVRVRDLGLMNVAITENDESFIASAASLSLNMGTDIEEYVYRTIGYSATCATMYLVYLSLLRLSGKGTEEVIEAYMADYMRAVEHLDGIVEGTHEWYEKHAAVIAGFDKFIFAGASDLLPVAMEADIKFMEMVPVFTNHFEMEELIHGPQNAFDKKIGYFLLAKTGIDEVKASHIAEFINTEIGHNAVLVGDKVLGDMDIFIDFASEHFYPLEIIAAFQVLAYRIAVDRGRDLRERINGSVNKYIQKSLV